MMRFAVCWSICIRNMANNWTDIIGHEANIGALQRMLAQDNIPHALLFSGPSGVGKMAAAQVLAEAYLCEREDARPCGRCPACQLSGREAHPNLFRLEPDGSTIKISQIRALQHDAALAPVRGQRRVCVINDAELMTTQAANCLLKLLEEPPEGFLFILVAQDSRPLLPTILSRCCRLRFMPLPWELLTQTLRGRGLEEPAAAVAARLGGGRLGKALEILQPGGLRLRDQAMELLMQISRGRGLLELREAVNVEQLPLKEAAALLQCLLGLQRDLLLLQAGQDERLIFSQDLLPRLGEAAPYWTENALLASMDRVRETLRAISGNANVRLSLEALWIRLSDLAKSREEGE